ncbi:MAG: DUF2911 domain-containing protein [Bacteroidetes bacterium]|nr:DUF2911 domain-containing protein [Bacteroidota bacterium]
MKSLFLRSLAIFMFLAVSSVAFAQANAEFPGLDKSPADILLLRNERGAPPLAKVIYGRPSLKGRPVFSDAEGSLAPLGEIWRTGANEATEVTFYKDVKVAGKDLKAGTYVLHSIPGKSEWTIILNSKLNVWGAYEYDESKDVLRVNIPSSTGASSVEVFSMNFKPGASKGTVHLVMGWGTTRVELPLTF